MKEAVLRSGGSGLHHGMPVSEQAFNYVPRIRQPVLKLNGCWYVDSTPDCRNGCWSCWARRQT